MKTYITALTSGVVLLAGCSDNPITNPVDNPTVGQVSGALTRSALQTLATGVLAQDRASYGSSTNYIILSEVMARDLYRIDASEMRYVTETLGGNPDPGSFAGGGTAWNSSYVEQRAINSILLGLPGTASTELTPAEKSATSGFLRTTKAVSLYRQIELRDTAGVVIQGNNPNVVDPIVCKTKALAYVGALLDSANADFTTAGGTTALPFKLPAGMTTYGVDYSKVSNLVLYNRGWKGKVDLYRALDHQSPVAGAAALAVTELTQALGGAAPGAVPASSFAQGAYWNFVPGGTENAPNILVDAKIGINPLVKDSLQAGDTRGSKIVPLPSTISGFGLSTSTTYVNALATVSANLSKPIAMLRMEELVLLRAQAYMETGDLTSARADINDVRTTYGLAAYSTPFASKAAAINAVLYEKRYSLLAEGPQRLVDLRAYGRLNGTYLRKETANDVFASAFPIPKGEADARNNQIAPSCS
ncbi:MAG: RagB/SusD family nutrient uptake outer membrane protein [Gemmatimonadota bacterium]|nr:RagB/SusD family nutrient uptake outer membrane protein [Gemmatimonadota bacterium]